MDAHHRLEIRVGGVDPAAVVAVDAQPVHFAADDHLLLAHDRDVVLGLAGDHAGIAADAGRLVDRHAPGVFRLFVFGIERRQIFGMAVLARR